MVASDCQIGRTGTGVRGGGVGGKTLRAVPPRTAPEPVLQELTLGLAFLVGMRNTRSLQFACCASLRSR